MRQSRIFTIPAGAPFLRVLAQSLLDGRLVEGFRFDPQDPLQLADATIYVPTRRAARALRSEFVELMSGRAAILPVIRPLGEIDEDAGFFDTNPSRDLDALPPIAPLARLVELANLVLAWRNKLPAMLRDIHSDSPLVAPASPADAIWLARALIEIIDQVETEETGWEALDKIELGDRAIWWQLTGEFIKIARQFWPERLAELNRSSPALHRAAAIRAEAARYLAEQTKKPVIVAGSTGSIPATADLIAAIHSLECGAVVLPGLDLAMDDKLWRMAGALTADGSQDTNPASRSHPQYGLFHLLAKLRATRSDVIPLADEEPTLELRSRAVSQAFTPAEADVNHLEWRESNPGLGEAFADVALIEAPNEREEALAIATALKLSLDGDGSRQAALVTPDRNLARRVCVELQRFGIEADDSAGTPLLSSHHGTLVRLVLESILRPGDPVALVSLLKHPHIRLGRTREELERDVAGLELLALRGGTGLANPAELTALVERAIADLKAPDKKLKRWQKRLLDETRLEGIRKLAADIEKAVEPLVQLFGRQDDRGAVSARHLIGIWAEATGRVLESFCTDDKGSLATLWPGDAGQALASLLRDIMESGSSLDASGPQWIDVMTALIAGTGIRPKSVDHPRVMIWGTLEARLQRVDTLILGGLNEGTWPGQTSNNPFLSRSMKTEIGLEPPERRIGQAAHDFVMALGTRQIILSRSTRAEGAPSVPSRFLQRLTTAVGSQIAAEMTARGREILEIAAQLDLGLRQDFAERPEPKPAAELQPVSYSFSEVSKLRRDPYSIYARRILKLDPVDPFNTDPGARERGDIYHRIIERFVRTGIDPASPSALREIARICDQTFDEAKLPAHIDTVWRPRFMEMAREFLKAEAQRQPDVARTYVEVGAALQTEHVRVTGRADRIDILKDGRADIIDYKTGTSPSIKEARALLDPQLALEAAVLKAGGFNEVPATDPRDLVYIRLRPNRNFKVETVNNENAKQTKNGDEPKSAEDLAAESILQLQKLTVALKEGRAGFKSRVAPKSDRDYGGEYDHLARVAEWSVADGEGEEAGDE